MVDLLRHSHPHHTCVCSRVLDYKQQHTLMLCRVAVLMHVLNFDFIVMVVKVSVVLTCILIRQIQYFHIIKHPHIKYHEIYKEIIDQ